MSSRCCKRDAFYPMLRGVWLCVEDIFVASEGSAIIDVFASLSEQGGTPAQRAARPRDSKTPAEI
jgi:hypothetical protein